MENRSLHGFAPRWRAVFTAFAATALLGGCDLLTVDNPGAITEPDLEDPARIPLIVHGVMGEFQRAYAWYTLYSASFSGETTDTHVFAQNWEIQRREVNAFTGLLGTAYARLQRTRAAGDIAAQRIRTLLGPDAEQHLGVARSLTYSGYALTLLAESYCEAPVDVSVAYSPEQLSGMAIERFDDAIAVATRARGTQAASADSLLALARLGAARAALNRGDGQRAAQYAGQVPAGFEFWVAFSENSDAEHNQFWNATREGNAHLQPGPGYLEMADPRVPRTPNDRILQTPAGFGSITGRLPLPPMNYSGWGTGTGLIQRNTNVRFASGLEARYIVAEVEGPTAATLALVNQRRAVGGQPAVELAGDALMAELRDQRRRDLYLTGHRLGDVRRYLRTGVGNYFPTGQWTFTPSSPGVAPRTYGTGTCWPIPIAEINSNPNLRP
jgi:hypothetical protein